MSDEQGSVLVACPTYAGKEYALDEYLAAYRALTYDPRGLYMVDNTRCRPPCSGRKGKPCRSQGYYDRLVAEGVTASRLVAFNDFEETFHRCWELIHEYAVANDYYWVYSVEADNIVAPESLQIMVDIALYGNIHLVTHTYPAHSTAAAASGTDPNNFKYDEMGCMLLSTRLLGKALAEYPDYRNIPLSIFSMAQKWQGGRCVLTERFEVKHLDGYQMEWWQFGPINDDRLFCPTPVVPHDYGTVLPPSLRVAS
jgi:hypothetical protein